MRGGMQFPCCLMFKYKFDLKFFAIDRPGTKLQSGPMFIIERPNSKHFISCVTYIFRNEWNKLPSHIRLLEEQRDFNL